MPSSFISKLWNFMKKIMKNIIFQAVSLAILLVGMGVTYAAWTTLTASQGASGQPVNQTLVQGIINNLNDLNTRMTAVESNTTGGTVTGPLRWSSEYGAMTYANAWTTCLALTPTNTWRLPSADEVDYGKRVNSGLFSGNKWYWSSSPDSDYSSGNHGFQALNPTKYPTWYLCAEGTTACTWAGAASANMAFRCVSNAY